MKFIKKKKKKMCNNVLINEKNLENTQTRSNDKLVGLRLPFAL